jgi:hypothetical protein
MPKLIISESEKKHILSLYGLINENLDALSGGTVTIQNFYRGGYYTLDSEDTQTKKPIKEKLNSELSKVTAFVQKNPNSIVSIKFESQESAIPNSDNEKKKNSRGGWLKVGQLSDYRKEYLQLYIDEYFKNLKSSGTISPEVEIPPIEYVKLNPITNWVGQEFCPVDKLTGEDKSIGAACTSVNFNPGNGKKNWQSGKDNDYKSIHDIYKSEQKSTLTITVGVKKESTDETPVPVDCLSEVKIRIFVERHNCQNAEFFVFANDTILYNTKGGYTANLNNRDTDRGIPKATVEPIFPPELLNPGYGLLPNGDGTLGNYNDPNGNLGKGRSDTFIITDEQSKSIIQQGKDKYNNTLNIFLYATTNPAHDDVCKCEITTKNGKVLSTTLQGVVGKLLTLDACGNEIKDVGKGGSQPDMMRWIQKLKSDRSAMLETLSKKGKINKNKQKKLDQKAILQEKVKDRVDKLLDFINELRPMYCGTSTFNRELFVKYYNDLNTMISTPAKEGEFTFNLTKKIIKPGTTEYVDKNLERDNMMGDVRYELDFFWTVYSYLFYNYKTDQSFPETIEELKKRVNKAAPIIKTNLNVDIRVCQ